MKAKMNNSGEYGICFIHPERNNLEIKSGQKDEVQDVSVSDLMEQGVRSIMCGLMLMAPLSGLIMSCCALKEGWGGRWMGLTVSV